ncbi:MAG: lipid A deacylase LpxR family protein [Gemmatimonadaceae bacterium]
MVSVAPSSLAAQSRWLPELRLDNDAYNFWIHPAHRPDEQYTNGVRATLSSNSAPWWGRRFAASIPDCAPDLGRRSCRLTSITLGQDIYTPKLDRAPYTVPDWEQERPYFGWLYLEERAQVASDRWLRTTTGTFGVSGPPSLGHVMQSLFHHINRKYTRQANGWETQVGFEPGLMLGHRVDALVLRLGPTQSPVLDLTSGAGATLGNVHTGGDAGSTMRVGLHLDHPWRPFAGSPSLWSAYLLGGGRLEYVARDMSLDGTLLRSGRHVDRVPAVREYQFGAGLRLHRLRLEYRAVTRSQEYETGPGHHTYSTMSAVIDPGH